MIVKFPITSIGGNFNGSDIMFVDFVKVGTNDITATFEKLNHNVEVIFDLLVLDFAVTNADGNIDAVVRVGKNGAWNFTTILLVNLGGSESSEICGNFDKEFIITDMVVFGFNFFTFAIFDDKRILITGPGDPGPAEEGRAAGGSQGHGL